MSAIVLGLVVAAALAAAILGVLQLMLIVPPNRAAVITGRHRLLPDGRKVGYRIVRGGRTIRVPILESVEYLSLEPRALELSVNNALSKGAIPLNLQLVATVRIASQTDAELEHSVERLLGKRPDEIEWLAYEALAANVRAALAALTPEEVTEDRLALGERLSEQVAGDLRSIGLVLEMMKIQEVTDEVGFFEAVARRRTAAAREEAQLAEAESAIRIAEAENRLRVREEQLRSEAEIARLAARQAEAEAEQELQQRRIAAERDRLKADVIAPAEAARTAADDRAWAAAAPMIATGRAKSRVLQQLLSALREEGGISSRHFTAEVLAQLIAYAAAALPDFGLQIPGDSLPQRTSGSRIGNGGRKEHEEPGELSADEAGATPSSEEDPWAAVAR